MPVAIMGLPCLLPLLITSLLNTNKELQQKLTITCTSINISNRHLGSPLQATPRPVLWNAGGPQSKMHRPKTWSQEKHRRKIKNNLIDKLDVQLKKIAKENKSYPQKWSLSKNLSFLHRVIGKK